MELVVDTNILFSYFWKESFTRKVILCQGIRLYAPEYALEEINKYKTEIIKKTKITEKEFNDAKKDIALSVSFIPVEEYSAFLKDALDISKDENDIDFFALCLKLKLPMWSNDVEMKQQRNVAVFSTKEMFGRFFYIVFDVV